MKKAQAVIYCLRFFDDLIFTLKDGRAKLKRFFI